MKPQILLATAILGLGTLSELNAVVTITRQPTNQWVSLGAHVTNQVTAISTAPPITYQWYRPAGPLLTGETNRTSVTLSLVLSSIQTNQAGGYYVVLSDIDPGWVQSDTAVITVDPTFIKLTEGPIVTDREPSSSSTWWDFDSDGLLDLYVLNNACFNGCPATNSLYRNVGDGTFEKITNILSTRVMRYMTAAVVDYDHDGDEDLYVLGNTYPGYDPSRYPPDELYRNEGNGTLAPVAGQPWRLDLDNSNDCSWSDYNRDGLLDVFVANVNPTHPECLYRQRTDGSFVKMTAAQVGSIVGVNVSSDACVWADYDNDLDPDLWLSSRDGHCRLHQNDGRGWFSAATNAGSVTTVTANGVGIWGDYDNDGWLDLFTVASPWAPVATAINALHRNFQGTSFTNVASVVGVALANNAWASAWGDYDNDGWLDLFVANFENGTNLFYRNLGDGTFRKLDVGSPIRDGNLRATVAWVDYDNDGFLDLFITCGSGTSLPNHLYRNNAPTIGNANHWLKIKLNGQASSRSGIGAKIRVKATIGGKEIWQVREISGNSGYQGGYGLAAHFGLGDASKADTVRVEWPSGNVQDLTDVPAGQAGQASLTITEQVFITPARPSSSLGGAVTLTSSRTGATAWQWYHDGVALDGQTAKTLALSGISTNDAGRYSVVVTTATGTVTNHVYLLVDSQFERADLGNPGASWGCAWGDYNNDGYPDLLIAQGVQSSPTACKLYRNNRDGTLIKVTSDEAGDIVRLERNWSYAAWVDYDGDGYLDLIVSDNSDVPKPTLWRNLGNGRFEDATAAGSFIADRLCGVPLWGDFDRNGQLDLAVGNAWDEPPSWPDWSRNLLYFNQGNGTFHKETQDPFVSYRARAMIEGGAAGDLDGDGDLDLVLGGHSSTFLLFENDGAGQFHQASFPTVAGKPLSPSLADYDNDGRTDMFVGLYDWTNTQFHRLLRNEGEGQWSSMPLGLSIESAGGSWADYDNDGDLDLFISRGRIVTTTNLFYANNGDGTFTQVILGSPANEQGRSRSSAWADYDNNGFLDLLVTGRDGFPDVLYRNHGNGNHWISFKLVGTTSNRSAIGAKVRVQATIFGKTTWQLREIGTGNLAQNDSRPHFGLGDSVGATTVRIEWPSGAIEEYSNLASDQFYTIVEPSLRGAMKPNSEFELTVTASTNRTCTLLASGDLSDWTTLTNFTGQGEVPVRIVDPEAPSQSQRFYQLK